MAVHSIGIIGGADGPTKIFLSGKASPLLAAGVAAVVLIITCILISWLRKK